MFVWLEIVSGSLSGYQDETDIGNLKNKHCNATPSMAVKAKSRRKNHD